jgi:hypothetical protein
MFDEIVTAARRARNAAAKQRKQAAREKKERLAKAAAIGGTHKKVLVGGSEENHRAWLAQVASDIQRCEDEHFLAVVEDRIEEEARLRDPDAMHADR